MRAVRAEPGLAVLVLATAAAFAAYAIVQHDHFGTGLDLGIFDQAIWHYSRLEAPHSTILGENLLGDHFHPILVLLAPLYWIWEDPRMLLIAQAVLLAASIVPVFLFARDRLGRGGGYLFAGAYAAFWGLGTGATYDFHELAFAPLLVALAILFADRRSWIGYFVAIALLLLVKENQAVLVCFFGLWLVSRRDYRMGAITVAAGLGWYALVAGVFIPHFSPGGYQHWTYGEFGPNLPDAVVNILSEPWRPFEVFFDGPRKLETLLWLFLPFLFLTLCSRLAILAIPPLAERFLSSDPALWGTDFHYSMVIAPILAMGAAQGLRNLAELAPAPRRTLVLTGGAAAILVAGLLVRTVAVPTGPNRLLRPAFYREPVFAGPVSRALERVPGDADVTVGTQQALLPHLARRRVIGEINQYLGVADYLVVGLVDRVGAGPGNRPFRALMTETARLLPHYEAAYYEDGWVTLRRRGLARGSASGGVLPQLPPAEGSRALAASLRWQRELDSFSRSFAGCLGRRARRDPGISRCLAGAGGDVGPRGTELAALLRSLRTEGGCRQLAALAAAGVVQYTGDLERLRAAAASGSDPEVGAALRAAGRDQDDRDLAGRVSRFLLLCSDVARRPPPAR
jgi:uncharacterized membrane protein